MTHPTTVTRVTLFLPRLSDDDAHYYGQGDPDGPWATRLVFTVGPGAVAEIGETRTLIRTPTDREAVYFRLRYDPTEVWPDGILVTRRLTDDEIVDPEDFAHEVYEVMEIGMLAESVEEIEPVITALPFREYRITAWAEPEADSHSSGRFAPEPRTGLRS